MKKIFDKCIGFQWDEGNSAKNWINHGVLMSECEQLFFNKPLIITESKKSSPKETRWYLLGKTDVGRKLFIVFTIRKNMVRVISARDMSKKEREIYDEEIKKHTKF